MTAIEAAALGNELENAMLHLDPDTQILGVMNTVLDNRLQVQLSPDDFMKYQTGFTIRPTQTGDCSIYQSLVSPNIMIIACFHRT